MGHLGLVDGSKRVHAPRSAILLRHYPLRVSYSLANLPTYLTLSASLSKCVLPWICVHQRTLCIQIYLYCKTPIPDLKHNDSTVRNGGVQYRNEKKKRKKNYSIPDRGNFRRFALLSLTISSNVVVDGACGAERSRVSGVASRDRSRATLHYIIVIFNIAIKTNI